MQINEILSRFQKVYKSGNDQWQCLCPVHEDKSPSVGIKLVNGWPTGISPIGFPDVSKLNRLGFAIPFIISFFKR